MTKKLIGSVVLAGVLASAASAVQITPFGYVGVIANFGFGDANKLPGEGTTGYLGVTGHIGVDFNFSGFKIGAGAMAGFAPLTIGTEGSYTNNTYVGWNGSLYRRPWVELSDLYLGYQGSGFDVALGRYNASKILATADWIGGHNQGFALAYQSSYFGIWATWVNDYLRNGYNANSSLAKDGRYGMDISGMGSYASSWNNFNVNNELFALGADFKFGEYVSLSPYAQYWLRNNGWSDTLQAGARLIVSFNAGPVKSTTTGRFLWSNNINNGGNGFMWQADQEFVFIDMIKLGGGYLSIGNIGLGGNTIVDRTRFYGQYLYPGAYNGTGLANRGYLDAGVNTWYVFTGFKLGEALDLDILYADGDYKEFSTILNYNIIGGEKLTWSVGGGYVTNGFGNAHTGLVYTKLKF
ncbi:hypothetical protein CQA53_07375 [Helicobacter didelphidarum]|uniref:Outer membrane family protein n=1 Tax=Helicobacter didelphidarum TaxID=2040648 RepID=A0A3D8IID5_9HELI|nr:hypothetical protein [Helicobacter didelphidarum]RDU64883.1 hypothetical protein CQA53_07375 [Helicobacter didelphidarum]